MTGAQSADATEHGRDTRRSAANTWVLVAAPIVAAAGFVARPHVSDFTDEEVMATAIAEHSGQWMAAALVMAAGAALLAFALPAAVQRVGAGGRRGHWVRPAVTVGVVGFALHTGLVGLGAAAAGRMGADISEFLDAAGSWESAVISASLLALLIAWGGVIRTVVGSAVSTSTKWVVVVGAAIGGLGHLYPASLGEYIASVGTAAALWPLAAHRPGSPAGTAP